MQRIERLLASVAVHRCCDAAFRARVCRRPCRPVDACMGGTPPRMRPRRAQGRGAGSFAAAAAAGRVTGRAGARTRRTDRTLGGSAQALSPAWFWRRVTASAACYAGPASGIEGTSGLRGMAEIEVPRRCGTQGGAPWSKAESLSNRDTFHRFSTWEQDGYLCHRSGRGSKLSPCHLRAGVEVVVIT